MTGVTRLQLEKLAALAPKRETRAAAHVARTGTAADSDPIARARAYIATIPGAVSGQKGHDRTFYAANRLVRGFNLSPEVAYPLLAEWNANCNPPWSEHELRRKLEQAARQSGPRGFLLSEPPPQASGGVGTVSPFSNTIWEEVPDGTTMRRRRRGRSLRAMCDDLTHRTCGWPRRCGPRLFVIDRRGEVQYLRQPADLFAWIDGALANGASASPVEWESRGDAPNKAEFLAALAEHAERYDAVEQFPHEPPLPGHYYIEGTRAGGDGKALAELLQRFRPATAEDEDLIRALLLTLIWGGPPGSRPAFLISTRDGARDAGRGAGKTKLAEKLASIVGGFTPIKPGVDFEKWTSSYLSGRFASGAGGARVVLLDNLKSLRFSNADLEALVTGERITGHVMYTGLASVPNTLTLVITANGPSLSKDLAQRAIPIEIEPAEFAPNWEADIDEFIRANRDAIIGDCIAELRAPPRPMSECLRWATWCGAVLARQPDPDALVRLIKSRQAAHDADAEVAEQVRTEIVEAIRRARPTADPETLVVRFSTDQMAEIAGPPLDEKRHKKFVTEKLRHSVSVRGLVYDLAGGTKRGWVFRGHSAPRDAEPWTYS